MKNKLWLFQIPVVALFVSAYLITDLGFHGELTSSFARRKLYGPLQRVATMFTDWKFKLRGAQPPKNKIVVIEIDGPSIDTYGRWPWHRDVTATLIDKAFSYGAKVVGLDMFFSEPDKRVPKELEDKLAAMKMGDLAKKYETDPVMSQVIFKHSDKLVLGWAVDAMCQPRYAYRGMVPEGQAKPDEYGFVSKVAFDADECPVGVDHPGVLEGAPQGYEKFAYSNAQFPESYDSWKTGVWSILTMVPNLQEYNQVAEHAGYFNAFPDHDGVIRRAPLLMLIGRTAYPSLALEMARVGLKDTLQVSFKNDSRIEEIKLASSGRKLPVSSSGAMEVNFKGGGHSFTYVSAQEIMNDQDVLEDALNGRKLAGQSKRDVLKDAYVLIGVSALGSNDMRNFPFEENVAGVEGHANILDNILSGDMLVSDRGGSSRYWMLGLMIVGALLFAYAIERLEAVPALALFIVSMTGFGLADLKLLFARNINWNTGFFAIEIGTIFILTLAAKYVMEERNKKFVKGAFAKYVSPAVVDSIIKDPTKLQVGGVKKDLTIMFSDIRSFTTFSERMDAKALAAFLNDYLGIMTKIVFAHEGTLDKYIGDAIMAFWGAPLDQSKHALNSCKGAIAMMRALAENKKRFLDQYGVDVNIGVGINSGAVSVGNMGSTDNFSYTVIGDHVNLASRLEGLTKAYGVTILTTRFTFDEIAKAGDALPAHRVLDHVKVKGKKNAVELIQVLERDLPAEGLKLFEEGRTLYTQQRWDDAIAKFTEAGAKLTASSGEKDGPCEVYLERCRDFKATPPEKNWDGSWEMHSK